MSNQTSPSRSAAVFLRRIGAVPTDSHPLPRFDPGALKISTLPRRWVGERPNLLLDTRGTPPGDRGRLHDWPPPQELPETD